MAKTLQELTLVGSIQPESYLLIKDARFGYNQDLRISAYDFMSIKPSKTESELITGLWDFKRDGTALSIKPLTDNTWILFSDNAGIDYAKFGKTSGARNSLDILTESSSTDLILGTKDGSNYVKRLGIGGALYNIFDSGNSNLSSVDWNARDFIANRNIYLGTNNNGIIGKDSSGTLKNMMLITSSNSLDIGEVGTSINLLGESNATTAPLSDNSTKIATTEFVREELESLLAFGSIGGIPLKAQRDAQIDQNNLIFEASGIVGWTEEGNIGKGGLSTVDADNVYHVEDDFKVNMAGTIFDIGGIDIQMPPPADGTQTYDTATGEYIDFKTDVDPKYGDIPTGTEQEIRREGVARASEGTFKGSAPSTYGESFYIGDRSVHLLSTTGDTSGISAAVTGIALNTAILVEYEIYDYAQGGVYFYNDIGNGALHEENGFYTEIIMLGSLTPSFARYGSNPTSLKMRNISIRPVTNEIRTSPVDMDGLESFAEAITPEHPMVYPFGGIQKQDAEMSGIPTTTGNLPASYYGCYTGDEKSIGKGVNWYSITDEQRRILASDPTHHIWVDTDGTVVQDRVRARSFGGLGNGDWELLESSSLSLANTLRFLYLSRVRCMGQLTADRAITSDTSSSFVGYTYDYWKPTGMDKAIFGNKSPNTSYTSESYFLVLGTTSRLNTGAYHQSHCPFGDDLFADGKDWSQTSLPKLTQKDCFLNSANNTDEIEAYGGMFSFDGSQDATETFKITTADGRPWLLNGELVPSDVDVVMDTADIEEFSIAVTDVNIQDIYLVDSNLLGDIGQFSDWRPASQVYLYGNLDISGDIGQLSGWRPTDNVLLYGTNISGDIGQLANWRPGEYVYFHNTNISGDIGQLLNWRIGEGLTFYKTNISTCSSDQMFPTTSSQQFYGCSIDQIGVDNLIASAVNGGQVDGILRLEGGTNAIPSSAGLANITILEGRGWTVSVNS